jgi:hypothetical protein
MTTNSFQTQEGFLSTPTRDFYFQPTNCTKLDLLQKIGSIAQQLTDKQRSYVLKLGAARARDIVPIQDLNLYRELLKLEMIVDKGRRLALSQFGRQVHQHLIEEID